jgi:hypothetical protein
VARIYEGTLDAPVGGYVVVPSWPSAGPQQPAPPGRDAVIVTAGEVKTLLAALDDAAGYKRDQAGACADCTDRSCTTCQWPPRPSRAAGHDRCPRSSWVGTDSAAS